jgi:hypothetical protein
LGGPFCFPNVYPVITKRELSPGETHRTPAAMWRLFRAVCRLPKIKDSAGLMCTAIEPFRTVVHWHGSDDAFLRSIGVQKTFIDLGKVFERFMRPVRKHFRALGERIKFSQEVACLVLSDTSLPPHKSQNDAKMLLKCLEELARRCFRESNSEKIQ